MRRFTLLLVFACFTFTVAAQNVGIGTIEPFEKLQVTGNLLVQQPYSFTNTAPTPSQTKTMVNATNTSFLDGDSTGRIYDPGGPAGNYLPNLTATVYIDYQFDQPFFGIELIVEDMDLGTGDSLIIKNHGLEAVFRVGNGYTTTGKYVFNAYRLIIEFKSNDDGQTGRGFSLLFKKLFTNNNLPSTTSAFGNVLFFDASKGNFRVGFLDDKKQGLGSVVIGSGTAQGDYSTSLGYVANAVGEKSVAIGTSNASGRRAVAIGNSTASGDDATSFGFLTQAIGRNSLAAGRWSQSAGNYSTVFGYRCFSSGDTSVAMGDSSTASGNVAIAIGKRTTASGTYSTALGNFVSTNNQSGAFIIGDNSTRAIQASSSANSFTTRFAGGYKLYTNSLTSIGVQVGPGGNSWTTISDVNRKENFAAINGESFLQKIKTMNFVTWNYIGQDPQTFRHYGPMAQDFYAAFGKDSYGTIGNDTTINQADFDGINLIAIQALEKRTSELKEALVLYAKIISELKKEVEALKNRK